MQKPKTAQKIHNGPVSIMKLSTLSTTAKLLYLRPTFPEILFVPLAISNIALDPISVRLSNRENNPINAKDMPTDAQRL